MAKFLSDTGLTHYHEYTLPTGVNLLHNADWGYSVVNQREFDGQGTNQYCIDRWRLIGTGEIHLLLSSGYHTMVISSGTTLMQKMEISPAAVFGKSAVFAYEDSNRNIHTVPISFPSIEPVGTGASVYAEESCEDLEIKLGIIYDNDVTIYGTQFNTIPYISITNNSNGALRIGRVWLELGNVCHMNTTPPLDYATNLAICQRYYIRFLPTGTLKPAMFVCTTKNYIDATIALPVPLRTKPKVTYILNPDRPQAQISRANTELKDIDTSGPPQGVAYSNHMLYLYMIMKDASENNTIIYKQEIGYFRLRNSGFEVDADFTYE